MNIHPYPHQLTAAPADLEQLFDIQKRQRLGLPIPARTLTDADDQYFVEDHGGTFRESSRIDRDRDVFIRDIIDGQYEDVRRIIVINIAECRMADATHDICERVRDAARAQLMDEPMPSHLVHLLEEHIGEV